MQQKGIAKPGVCGWMGCIPSYVFLGQSLRPCSGPNTLDRHLEACAAAPPPPLLLCNERKAAQHCVVLHGHCDQRPGAAARQGGDGGRHGERRAGEGTPGGGAGRPGRVHGGRKDEKLLQHCVLLHKKHCQIPLACGARQGGNGAGAASEQGRERLTAAQGALGAFMEDVIGAIAGHVPLKAIAERILAAHAADPFGDFKVSRIPLLSAKQPKGESMSLSLAAHAAGLFGKLQAPCSPLLPIQRV